MRFQADLNPKDASALAALKEELQVQSNAELLANTLAIVRWLVGERRQRRRIASIADGTPVRELVSPLLERAAAERELPRVEIEWKEEELKHLASLMSSEPAEPTPALLEAMKRL